MSRYIDADKLEPDTEWDEYEDGFISYSHEIAKETFMREVDNMGDSDFKDFCINNFEQITGEES